MIQDETVRELTRIGSAKLFKPQDYICSEGQPGSEMYVILRGSVGVYISSAVDEQIEVARLGEGDFFGEMAVLDNQPRSASCIALENTLCAEIGRDKLQHFIAVCPAIALKVLENLSLRIRGLSNALYKSSADTRADAVFEIPAEYSGSHHVVEPPCNKNFLNPVSGACPICGRTVEAFNVKTLNLTAGNPRKDGRTFYKECDPLWHSIWSCPNCGYSNFYGRFFAISPEEADRIDRLLQEQHDPAIAQRPDLNSPFDRLFIHYLQAIHINQNGSGHLLTGRLWLNLYWLFDDANDPVMKTYCAERAAAALAAALEAEEIPDERSRLTVKLALTNMYGAMGDRESAARTCGEVLACTGHLQLRQLASELQKQYRL